MRPPPPHMLRGSASSSSKGDTTPNPKLELAKGTDAKTPVVPKVGVKSKAGQDKQSDMKAKMAKMCWQDIVST